MVLIILAALMPPAILKADPPGGSTLTDTYQPYAWQYNVHFDTVNGYEWQLPLISLMQSDLDNWAFFVFRQIDHNATDIKTATLSFYSPFNSENNATHSVTIYGFRENDTDPLTLDPLPGPVTPPISRHVTTNTAILNVTTWAEGWHNVTVTDIVKEIVGLPGWVNLNNIGFKTLAVADVDRYIWSYSGNSTLSAKLYIEYYSGVKTYPGDWDNGIIFNTTEDGEMWEIWNGTAGIGYLWGYRSGNPVQFFEATDTGSSSVVGGGSSYFDSLGCHFQSSFIYNGYSYLTVVNNTGVHLWKTIDGDSFIYVRGIIDSTSSYAIYFDNSTNILHTLGRYANTLIYYQDYNVATNTRGTATPFTAGYCVGVYSDGTYIWAVSNNELNIYVWRSSDNGASWGTTATVSTTYNNPTYTASCIFFDDSGTHTYVTWINGWNYVGNLVQPNLSVGTVELIIGSMITYAGPRMAIRPSDKQIRYFIALQYNTPPFAINDVITATRNYGTGAWSSFSLLTNVGAYSESLSAYYNIAWDLGNYTLSFNDKTDRSLIHVWSGSGSNWAEIDTYDFTGYTGTDGLLMGGSAGAEGTHYYQFHWFNCTWEPYYPTPTYPTPPVEPEENVPDPVTGLVYFDRFHMRLYMLMFGLGCFLMPPIMWAMGNDDLKMVLGGLISMVIGVGLLISITAI